VIIGAIVTWILFGIITMLAANKKGRDGPAWFIIGILLGPFGFIIALLLDPIEETSESEMVQNENLPLPNPPELIVQVSEKPVEVSNIDNVVQDFSDQFVFNWPLALQVSELTIAKDKSFVRLERIQLRNVQHKAIKYSEWEILCYDILSRQITSNAPILLKIEEDVDAGVVQEKDVPIELPADTRKIDLRLLNVLFDDGQILNLEGVQPQTMKIALDPIIDVFRTGRAFLDYLDTITDWEGTPTYIYKINAHGIWNCTFCGIPNQVDHDNCQCCKAPLELQESFSERNLLEVFSQWKSEQLRKNRA